MKCPKGGFHTIKKLKNGQYRCSSCHQTFIDGEKALEEMRCPKKKEDFHHIVKIKKEPPPFPDGRIEYRCIHCNQQFFDDERTDKEVLALINYGKLIGLHILYWRYGPWLQKLIQSPRILCRSLNLDLEHLPWHLPPEVAEGICDEVFVEFFKKFYDFQEEIENWKPSSEDSISPIASKLWFIASRRFLDLTVKTAAYKQQQKEVSLEQLLEPHEDETSPSQEVQELLATFDSIEEMEKELCFIKCTQKMLELIKAQVSPECYKVVVENIENCLEGQSDIVIEKIKNDTFKKCQYILKTEQNMPNNRRRVQCYIAKLLQCKDCCGASTKEIAEKTGRTPAATRQLLSRDCRALIKTDDDPIKSCLESCGK